MRRGMSCASRTQITIVEEEQEFIYQIHSAVVRGDDNSIIGTVDFNDITAIRNVERMKTQLSRPCRTSSGCRLCRWWLRLHASGR